MSVELTHRVKAMAMERGFVAVGVAPATPVPHAEAFLAWLEKGMHGSMSYLERNVVLRLNPAELVPGARSVLCLAAPCEGGGGGLLARYATGRDYHKSLKQTCIALMDALRELVPQFEGRAFVDSAPVMERSLAAAAGLGWIGSNGCLIVPRLGSHVLLCEIICNLPLVPDSPLAGDCGRCGQCVQACPTGAILPGGLLDARRCISYLTIEHEGEIAPEFWPRMGRRIFGCDACQRCCPHNVVSTETVAGEPDLAVVLGWTEADWDAFTRGRTLRRASLSMFLRNAAIAAGNSGREELVAPLRALLERSQGERAFLQPVVRWAIGRL